MNAKPAPSLAQRIGKIHLGYLSLLPAAGTFALIAVFRLPINGFLFLIVGTAAVGIYLGVTNAYTPIGNTLWKNLTRLLDGPMWIAIGALVAKTSVASAVVETVTVETLAILLGTLGVVLTSRIPTSKQRLASLAAVGIPLLGTFALAWMFAGTLAIPTIKLFVLGAAIVQSAVAQFRLVNKDEVMRPSEDFIILGIAAWILSLFISYGVMFSTAP